jgi:hypothetical protein
MGAYGCSPGAFKQVQYIVFFRRTQEQAYDVQLALAQIGRGFERLEISLVLYSEDDDRRGCVDVGVREDSAKDGTHPLELDAGAASLFLGGVADYYKMGRRHFEPGKGLRTC